MKRLIGMIKQYSPFLLGLLSLGAVSQLGAQESLHFTPVAPADTAQATFSMY